MTKKALKKVAAKAPVKKPSPKKVHEEIASLENALENKPAENLPTPAVEETPAVEQTPVVEETPIVEAAPVIETAATVQEIKEEKLSIWDDNDKGTEEDANKQDQENLIESLADKATELTDEAGEDEKARKMACRVKADITVELADCFFMLICLLLTWDFSDGNQVRFTLNKDRKSAIANNLYKINLMDKKKPEPKKDIIYLIIGSYLPMLLIAVVGLVKRLRKKQEDKKAAAENLKMQNFYRQQMAVVPQQNNAAQFEVEQTINRVRSNSATMMHEEENLRVVKPRMVKTNSQSSRGVKSGTKRGSYKKSA